MAVFVLVHGAWHGGWCWQRLIPLLRRAGHDTYAPTLTGLGERAHLRSCVTGLETHVQDVVAVMESEGLTEVLLVGHSLAGMKLPAIAERIPERLAAIVNVDGMIPLPGQSIRDLIPDVWARSRKRARASGDAWWVPPPDWDFGLSPEDLAWVRPRLTPDPMRTWTTPIHYTPERAGRVPALFIHCAEGLPAEEVHAEEQNCRKLGWAYEALPATHDPMVSSPDLLAELLLRRLTGGGRGPGSTAPEVAAGARCLGCNDVPIVSRARAPGGALRSSELSVR